VVWRCGPGLRKGGQERQKEDIGVIIAEIITMMATGMLLLVVVMVMWVSVEK
jgi:hypothetical protein